MKKNLFQMYELEAFLGEYIDDYDVDAIVEAATEIGEDGNRYWIEDADMSDICWRFEKSNLDKIENWDEDGAYADWYAIDAYDPQTGKISRVFVGSEEKAADLMRNVYSEPSTRAMSPFYRCAIIATSEARAYFENFDYEVPDERSVYSITEAAGILGISRQRVHQLIKSGGLDAHRIGNAWFIYRYSVENRLEK